MKRDQQSSSALKSLDASLIGLVMAGCIGVGYFAGNWLDGRMGTTYWTPILVVVGVMAGARQMWVTVSRIQETFSTGNFDKMNISEFQKNEAQDAQKRNRAANADSSHRKPRFFHVPPPPEGSKSKSTPAPSENDVAFNDQIEELKQLQSEIEQIDKEDESN